METKKTVGKQYIDNLSKNNDTSHVSVLEMASIQQAHVMDEIIYCIKHAQKSIDCSKRRCEKDCQKHITPVEDCYALSCAEYCKKRESYLGSLYVTYEIKQEKLMPHLHRFRFTWTIDCPTPTYDQSVFKYDHISGDLRYLWTIPDRDTCIYLLKNAKDVIPNERQLLDLVIQFASGELFRKMKIENGEKFDTPELEKS